MKRANNAALNLTIHAQASKVYGVGLWDKTALIASGVMANTINKPLSADADPRKLVGPAMYYQLNKFGDVQIVIKYEGDGWSYAGILRDKDGDAVTSDENKYEIHEVVARSEFKFTPEGEKDAIVIQKGFQSLKAYAL